MSNQAVLKFISEHQNELSENLAGILKEMNGKISNAKLTEHMYQTISNEYIHILMNYSAADDENVIDTIYQFSSKAVQRSIPLKLLSSGLAAFWKHLYYEMNKGVPEDKQCYDLIWQIDKLIEPINSEILNQYAISWEKTVAMQKVALQELSAPLIPVFDNITVMPLVGTIDTERAKKIMENLLSGVAKHRSEVVLIDITGVPVVDTMVAHHIIQASEAVRLVGAKCLLVGIRPEIAQTIVNLGIDLTQVITKNTLQKGIQTALEMTDRKIVSLEE
ncbi:RsbT co-antagonist protein RsbRA [Bacillus swezeyi]|uniref:RsbT co-antagonist protein RsbRA n=1 Tax=Bacillus swezeyi TaxID=1925020 RepID=A0A1R1QK41_9BACI|nr:RsbT co-antagonist protein RsbRA [Bacillus swezeyi]MEC1262118.1 RsbT co-antagonist protein RsbRA [Bacillus swezeyi]MED1738915.1 RsbT co-antagonist protein RsbRA [Bacillus swezeyi]MED2928470.1 RsbT co-antagonist protein RsbRA [Bacillus swezeyi]MED2942503.1 RsbT co-antagonist protein RsbRA [Bacillus swezeyi]MED2964097.1 RsbT co-antagonist protein RsbRA [Bacillus swezeyi]